MDYIDLYIIHRWDYIHPIEETMEALNECVKSGKVKYIGCSAIYPYQLLKANMIARKNGWAEFISIQNHYNIIYREDERELVQLIEEEKMTMTPYSPLAAGRVCRMWSDNTKRFETDKIAVSIYDKGKENDMPIFQRIKEISEKKKITMAQVSMTWILNKKYVSSPVIGCTKIKQLEELISAVKIKLTEDEIKYLEELYKPHKPMGAFTKEDTIRMEKFFNSKKK